MTSTPHSIPVVDVDNAFPAMVERSGSGRDTGTPGDLGPQVTAALRDALGWRPRSGDPLAFQNALRAAFRLRMVQGHVEADFVPRGYAVQADLGAVTGGQASLYRRATLVRGEALRILDGLVPLSVDADPQDIESYRLLVRNGVERLVDELGAPGGPRIQMIDMYFAGLTGDAAPDPAATGDSVRGQLGVLRDRFGLTDDNVNTVEEEGIRTAYWTLADLVTDLHASWSAQRDRFSGADGQGFLGTDLILLSRLMEAATDQVEEVEDVLDSVLISASERRTLILETGTGLTLDGLLGWIRDFLGQEGRLLAQEGGRDGIVAALAPMAVEIVRTFRDTLAAHLEGRELNGPAEPWENVLTYLPAGCCQPLPAGMYAARTRIAVAGLCRLLTDLAKTAQRIGRFSRPYLFDATVLPVRDRPGHHLVTLRGINLRLSYIPAFFVASGDDLDDCSLDGLPPGRLVRALRGSSSASDETVSAIFDADDLNGIVPELLLGQGGSCAADGLPIVLIDGDTGQVVLAPEPQSWPTNNVSYEPLDDPKAAALAWLREPRDEDLKSDLSIAQVSTASALETHPVLSGMTPDEIVDLVDSPEYKKAVLAARRVLRATTTKKPGQE